VKLLFLIRKGEDSMLRIQKFIEKVYETIDNTFYMEIWFNIKAKLRVHYNKLRMEFYIDILQINTMKGENVLSMYWGSKFMLASKVRFPKYSTCYL